MAGVDIITRFVAYLPDDTDHGNLELQHIISHAYSLDLVAIKQEHFALAVSRSSKESNNNNEILLDVFPGTAVSSRISQAPFDQARNREQVHEIAEQSAQCYNLLHINSSSFSLESDALGLKPAYIARTDAGHILASRITDILTLFPNLAKPADTVALFELMTFWAPLAERTLHRAIRRTLPGGCYEWSTKSPLRQWRGRDLQPAEVDPHRLIDRTIEEIRDAATESLRAKTLIAEAPIVMTLSGGFDSRLIAALCRDQKIQIRSLTFAPRHTTEWHSAHAIAKALQLDLERVHYRTDTLFHYIDNHLQIMEGTADLATLSIMNIFQCDAPLGTSLLHGFGGDIQSGSQVQRYSANEYASYETLADATLKSYHVSTRPDLLRALEPAVDLDEIRADLLSGFRRDCPPYQAYLSWYEENRTRRFVASQLALLGTRFDCILPYYDRRLFDIWNSIPPIARANRNVYRKLMATYYPALARIPHPEEPAPITPNLQSQLVQFLRGLPMNALQRLVGEEKAKRFYQRLYRDPNIYTLSNLHAPQQQIHMYSRIKELRSVMRDTLGVNLAEDWETALSKNLLALRGMFMAAEYAQLQTRTFRVH